MLMDAKPFWQSRTFWANLAVGIAAVFWDDIKPYVSAEHAVQIVALGNLVLRAITTSAVTLK